MSVAAITAPPVPARPNSWGERLLVLYAGAAGALAVDDRHPSPRRRRRPDAAGRGDSSARWADGVGSQPPGRRRGLGSSLGNRATPAGVNPSMRHATIWLST